MAKAKSNTSGNSFTPKVKKKRPGIHSKKKHSKLRVQNFIKKFP